MTLVVAYFCVGMTKKMRRPLKRRCGGWQSIGCSVCYKSPDYHILIVDHDYRPILTTKEVAIGAEKYGLRLRTADRENLPQTLSHHPDNSGNRGDKGRPGLMSVLPKGEEVAHRTSHTIFRKQSFRVFRNVGFFKFQLVL